MNGALQAGQKRLVGIGGGLILRQAAGKGRALPCRAGAGAAVFGIQPRAVKGGLIPVVPALGADVGAKLAVQQHGFRVVPPGAAQINAALRHALPKEAAVGKHIPEALPLRGGGGGGVALGKGVAVSPTVHGHNVACFKPCRGAAEDEVNIPLDAAAAVGVALGQAGRELLGADEAVFLQFLRGQGRGEQRVLEGA